MDSIDKIAIKNEIKRQMIEELRATDLDMICCDYILNELSNLDTLSEDEEQEIAEIVFEEWRKYVDKIEEFFFKID